MPAAPTLRHVPNAISVARLCATPVLIGLAWAGLKTPFTWLLLGALLSDAADGYIARAFSLTSPVGALLVGDANADGVVNEADIGAIRQEFFENGLSVGTPDCNADGKVNSGDAVCVVNEGLGG